MVKNFGPLVTASRRRSCSKVSTKRFADIGIIGVYGIVLRCWELHIQILFQKLKSLP